MELSNTLGLPKLETTLRRLWSYFAQEFNQQLKRNEIEKL
jgi:hypothetical protein